MCSFICAKTRRRERGGQGDGAGGGRATREKKPLKMNHGKVINRGRTVRVGVRTFSFPLERNKTLQLTARFGEGRPGAQQDQDRRVSKDRNRISGREQIRLGWLRMAHRRGEKASLKAHGIF